MSGFCRCWPTCVFLLSMGYISSSAAKLQNSYDNSKNFEALTPELCDAAVFERSNSGFEFVYLGADTANVIQSVKEGIAVNIHP